MRPRTPVRSIRGFVLIVYCAALLPFVTVHAEPDFEGSWLIDEKLSDDPRKAFKGKLKKISYPTPRPPKRADKEDTTYDRTQDNYWDTVREGKERSSIKDLRRLGTVYPLVKNSRFDIARHIDGYEIVYDGELPRNVIPNPEGRVFSASGDELVVDTLGHTLSYWDGQVLVLESDPPTGGKVIERLEIKGNPRQLHHSIKLRMRILKEPVELKRVFQSADTSAHDHAFTAH
jgi:hypothetical protein